MVDVAEVERRTELVKARSIEIGTTLGGIVIQSVNDLEQISLRLARGLVAVPAHCRDQPGVVYALCMQALEWKMPIMSVINKSYVPRGGDRIGFESQLLHAVIERNAPLKGRLRYEMGKRIDGKWIKGGEGDDIRCRVWATFEGEEEPHEYYSQTLEKLHPGRVTKDGVKYVKGSPLWDSNPEVQMFYSASRQWARLFCPDVLLGAYTPDEIEEAVESQPVEVSSKIASLSQRLRDANLKDVPGQRGFNPAHAARETGRNIIEGEARDVNLKDLDNVKEVTNVEDAKRSGDEPRPEGRADAPDSVGVGDHDEGGSVSDGRVADEVRGEPVGENPAQAEQAEIFPPDREPKGKGKQR